MADVAEEPIEDHTFEPPSECQIAAVAGGTRLLVFLAVASQCIFDTELDRPLPIAN